MADSPDSRASPATLPSLSIEALRSAVRERRSVMVAGDEAMPQVFPSAPAMLVRQLIKLIGIERARQGAPPSRFADVTVP